MKGPSMTSQIATLTFDVHLTDELPVVTDDLPPRSAAGAISADLVDSDLRGAGGGPGRYVDDDRPSPRPGRLDRRQRQAPDDRLHHARPWRPLVRPGHCAGALP